ncbi:hypothetical protein N0V82_009110 [Gnomoniopsis sp. IMI 355080]|nr:hypothetical protein N0V82_009110 [Gnomoniopsis sp. IMI 355080]
MHFSTFLSMAAFTGLATALPQGFSAPTEDGFPNPNPSQLAAIQVIADGQLSNAPPPAKLADSSLTAFKLIAFNENFEVAFFSSLMDNITDEVAGYQLEASEKKELLNVLQTVKAQEELHSLNARNTLSRFGAFAPQPCTYKFPTTDFHSALALAATFTPVVLGTLQDASQLLATNGDAGPVRGVASVIGQEGEQNGWYRSLLGYKPSEKPFLTTSVAPFAYSVLQNFVDSCPFDQTDKNLINITIFPTINVLSGEGGMNVLPQDQTLEFSADLTTAPAGWQDFQDDCEGLFVTYFTGQNLPISEPVQEASFVGNVITFKANFPFSQNVMQGLSIASLTTSGNFSGPGSVPAATLAAPGLIQVNDMLS